MKTKSSKKSDAEQRRAKMLEIAESRSQVLLKWLPAGHYPLWVEDETPNVRDFWLADPNSDMVKLSKLNYKKVTAWVTEKGYRNPTSVEIETFSKAYPDLTTQDLKDGLNCFIIDGGCSCVAQVYGVIGKDIPINDFFEGKYVDKVRYLFVAIKPVM